MKQENKEYGEKLLKYDYTQEQIDEILKFRDSCEHMSFEQFTFLHLQGVVKRTQKLKTPRNLYVSEDGKIHYLNHWHKTFNFAGYFINEDEG